MKITAYILTVFWTSIGFAQVENFPDKLLMQDTLIISIKKSGCHVTYQNTLKISQLNDTTLNIQFVSPHVESYYFEKNEVYNYHKKESNKFLKENRIKLKTIYKQSDKPMKTITSFSNGLTHYLIMVETIDSIKTIHSDNYKKIENFYLKVKTGELGEYSSTDGIYFEGDYTYFDISLIRKNKLTKLIEHKETKGWYDFQLETTK